MQSLFKSLKIPISLGGIQGILDRVGTALEPAYNEIQDYVNSSKVIHADETSWYHNHKKKWVWVASNTQATLLKILDGRSAKNLRQLFPESRSKLIVADRYSAYNTHKGFKQDCWAHLKRDFTKISEREGAAKKLGNDLLELTRKLFEYWNFYKQGNLSFLEFQSITQNEVILPTCQYFYAAIENDEMDEKTKNFCRGLEGRLFSLWAFVYNEGVEPTNNLAERDLRPLVIFRKLTLGTHSEKGKQFVERAFSVIGTLKKRGKKCL